MKKVIRGKFTIITNINNKLKLYFKIKIDNYKDLDNLTKDNKYEKYI